MRVCDLSRGETEAEEAGGQHGPHSETFGFQRTQTYQANLMEQNQVEAEARTQISLISAELTARLTMPRLSRERFGKPCS